MASVETKQKISEAHKGQKPPSQKGRKPWNKGKKGWHWYTNGFENVMAFECPEGFVPGRTNI